MSWVHLGDTRPNARKRYRCIVCWEFIEVGEQHIARRGIDESGPHTCRMHEECCQYYDDENVWIDEPIPGQVTHAECREYVETRRPEREIGVR